MYDEILIHEFVWSNVRVIVWIIQIITMTMDNILLEPTLESVKGLLILDNDGNRILAKYYDQTWQGTAAQKKFEKTLFNKTHKARII